MVSVTTVSWEYFSFSDGSFLRKSLTAAPDKKMIEHPVHDRYHGNSERAIKDWLWAMMPWYFKVREIPQTSLVIITPSQSRRMK